MDFVYIDGQTFALGLFWQTLEGKVSDARTAARKKAAQYREQNPDEGLDRMAVRTKGFPQAGYGATGLRSPPPSRALAPAFAQAHPDKDWLGVYRLPDNRVWLIGSLRGLVVPRGDRVVAYSNYQDELDELKALLPPEALQEVYLDIDKATAALEVLASDLSAPVLEPIDKKSPVAKIVVVLGLIGIVIGASIYYKHYQEQRELEAIAEAQRLAAQQPVVQQVSPWDQQPAAAAVIAECMSRVAALPIYVGGWKLQTINCDAASLHLFWHRQPGGSYTERPEPSILDRANMDQAHQVFGFDTPPQRQHEDAADTSDAGAHLLEDARLSGVKVQLTAQQLLPGAAAGAYTPTSVLIFGTAPAMQQLAARLADVPALQVNSATWTDGHNWTVQATLYTTSTSTTLGSVTPGH